MERFERNREDYKSGRFNEAQARVDFTNPLFAELSWDVENRQQNERMARARIERKRAVIRCQIVESDRRSRHAMKGPA